MISNIGSAASQRFLSDAEHGPSSTGEIIKLSTNVCARPVLSKTKRVVDIALALFALIAFLPLFAFVAVLIGATSPGPIIFRQHRTGLGGRLFELRKFRTMYVVEDGDTIRHATRGDSRVTPIGAILRATSIDELPQLINVLRGDMSLVGPRPHAVAHDRHYGMLINGYARRFAVKPGITGLAQIRGLRGEIHQLSCMERRVNADCEYIERWSLGRDLRIILLTVPRMLGDPHAY